MGFFDSIVSFISPDAYAEEPAYQGSSGEVMGKDDTPAQKESNVKGGSERKPDEPEKTEHIKGEGDDEDKAEGASADEPEEEEAAEEEEPEEEEEEEEEEPEDPKPKIEAECAKTAACRHHVHEYDECVERVTAAAEDADHKGPKEDCVEEFFHMTHCVAQCAAPKLFRQLA